jgi:hypothetical protein
LGQVLADSLPVGERLGLGGSSRVCAEIAFSADSALFHGY